MKEIKLIVEKLEIPKKKEQLLRNREVALTIKRELSDLCFHPNVARYANNLDNIYSMIENIDDESISKLYELCRENEKLETDLHVYQYKELLKVIDTFNEQNSDYYKTIQTSFRDELAKIFSPKIYVYQGKIENNNDLYLDIVDKSAFISDGTYPNWAISPLFGLESKRKYRHFYNTVSYKYLEGVSNDYSFDLDNKRIGKVFVFKKSHRY